MNQALQSQMFDYCSISSFSNQQMPAIHNIFSFHQDQQEPDKKFIQLLQNLIKDKYIISLTKQSASSYVQTYLNDQPLNIIQYSFYYDQKHKSRKNTCIDIELYSSIDQSIENATDLIIQINLITKQVITQNLLNLIQDQLQFMGEQINKWLIINYNPDILEFEAIVSRLLQQLIFQVEQRDKFQCTEDQLNIFKLDYEQTKKDKQNLQKAILGYFSQDQHIIFYNYGQQHKQYISQLKKMLAFLTTFELFEYDVVEIQSQQQLYANSRIQFINCEKLNKEILKEQTNTQYFLYDITTGETDKLFEDRQDQYLNKSLITMIQILEKLFERSDYPNFMCYLSFVKTSFINLYFE